MNELLPDLQPQRKRKQHPVEWYRGRTRKTKLAFGAALVLFLLLVGIGVLIVRPPLLLPYKQAGVHITVTAVYYVSPAGNDTNDGSLAHPFATIQRAANLAQAGTTIHVLSGTYTTPINSTAKGTAQAPITFISDVKWGAKIITTGARTSWTNWGDFVTIQGFDITGDGDIGINNYGSYVQIIGNHVHNYAISSCGSNGAAGIDNSAYLGNHDNNILDNVVDHIGPPLTIYCNLDQGLYLSTPGGMVANNIVYNVSAYGIQSWHAAAGVTIANNLVFDCGQGGILVAANQVLADNFLVVNNIVIYNLHLGIYEFGQTGLHNQYLNNLVYGNPTNLLLQHGNRAPGTLMVNPHLVNFQMDGSGDYHLAPGSPAIGTGTSTGEPATDMDGFTRGTAIDLGPYAYRSGSTRAGGHILRKLP